MDIRSACWYYFSISNNGEIPEDELNYQTSNINSIETTSTMKMKILTRRLRSDMNDEYHKETIDIWTTKVVVQVVMPNDYSKQDQHDQKKGLEQCNQIDANKEDQVYYDSNSDDDTVTQVEGVSADTYNDDNYVLGKQSIVTAMMVMKTMTIPSMMLFK